MTLLERNPDLCAEERDDGYYFLNSRLVACDVPKTPTGLTPFVRPVLDRQAFFEARGHVPADLDVEIEGGEVKVFVRPDEPVKQALFKLDEVFEGYRAFIRNERALTKADRGTAFEYGMLLACLDEASYRLQCATIQSSVKDGETRGRPMLMGGTSLEEGSGGIGVWQNGFIIFVEEDGSFRASVVGTQAGGPEEKICAYGQPHQKMNAAITFILQVYFDRGEIPAVPKGLTR